MFKEESEIWKDVPGFEGAFQVSSFGRVRSLPRIDALGHHRKGILRKQGNVHDGYLQVVLEHNGKKSVYWVHRLVAAAFIPNKNGYPAVNHKDENPSNNRSDNLEWCTARYNNTYNGRNKRVAKALEHPNICVSSWKVKTSPRFFLRVGGVSYVRYEASRLRICQPHGASNN